MAPPMRATSRAAMVRPRPVPPYLRVVEVSSCSNARKMRSCWSGGMPMPVSRTMKRRPTSPPSTDGVGLSPGVAEQDIGHVRLHLVDQLQSLLVGSRGQGTQGVPDRPPQGEIGADQL